MAPGLLCFSFKSNRAQLRREDCRLCRGRLGKKETFAQKESRGITKKKSWCEGACYTYEVSSKTLTNAASRQEQLNMWQEIEKGAADEMKIQELQGLMEGVKKEGCWGSEERAKAHKRQEECSGGGEGSALN